jgi:hypothetical protein
MGEWRYSANVLESKCKLGMPKQISFNIYSGSSLEILKFDSK